MEKFPVIVFMYYRLPDWMNKCSRQNFIQNAIKYTKKTMENVNSINNILLSDVANKLDII